MKRRNASEEHWAEELLFIIRSSVQLLPLLFRRGEAADDEAEEGQVAGHHGADLDALEALAGEHGGDGEEGQPDHGEPHGRGNRRWRGPLDG